jgi:hypothetical protein
VKLPSEKYTATRRRQQQDEMLAVNSVVAAVNKGRLQGKHIIHTARVLFATAVVRSVIQRSCKACLRSNNTSIVWLADSTAHLTNMPHIVTRQHHRVCLIAAAAGRAVHWCACRLCA